MGVVARGYHGTTLDVAEKVAAGDDQLWTSENGYDWLGKGAYFWQDAPDRARIWARQRHGSKGQPLAVISVDVDLTNCLDLCDAVAFRELLQVYEDFSRLESLLVGSAPAQAGLVVLNGEVLTTRDDVSNPLKRKPMLNRRDHAIIDFFVELARQRDVPITSVRCPFIEGRALFPESFIFDWAHVQISVVDAAAYIEGSWSVERL